MTKYTSGRQKNLKVGLSSYSENRISLEVIGSATFIGSTTGELVRITQIGTGPAFLVEDSENPDVTPFVITNDGRVAIGVGPAGIGTIYKLEVDGGGNGGGDVRFVSGGQGDLIFSHSNLISNIRAAETIQLGLGANGGDAIRINLNNNVGLGSTNPTSKLYVVGDGYFTGVITASNFYVGGNIIGSATSLASLYVTGVSTFVGFSTFNDSVDIQDDLLVRGNTKTLGITTLSANGGITTTGGDLYVGGDLYIADDLRFDEFTARNANITGIATLGIVTASQLYVSGISTFSGITTVTGAALFSKQLDVSGVTTFTNGPVFVGSGTSTGTASQRLQITGGAYVSGAVGVGTTNPRETLDVIGTVGIQSVGSANRFEIVHNAALSSLDFIFI